MYFLMWSFQLTWGTALIVGVGAFLIWAASKRVKKAQSSPFVAPAAPLGESMASPVTTPLSIPEAVEEKVPLSPLQFVAQAAGRDIAEIKVILGIPLAGTCDAADPTEAMKIYSSSKGNSDMKYIALKRCIELENDYDRLITILTETDDLFPSLRQEVWKKAEPIYLKAVQAANTEDELLALTQNVLCGEESEKLLFQKLYDIFKQQDTK